MKKYIAFLLLATASVFAQNEKLLIGKWDFVKTDLAKTEKAALKPSYAVKDFILEFSSDGKIRTTELHRSMVGTWALSEGGNSVEAQMESGRLLLIPLMETSDNQIIVNYRNGIQVLKRVSKDEPSIKVPEYPKSVPVKPADISGRWKAREILMEDGSKVPRAQMPNVQFSFKADGALEAFSQGQNTEGRWRLGKDDASILASMNGEIVVFYVLSASAKELMLREGPGGITMILARMP